jgi:hypothetical protein
MTACCGGDDIFVTSACASENNALGVLVNMSDLL